MKTNWLFTISICFLLVGCKSQTTRKSYNQALFIEFRNNFAPAFTDHFPDSLSTLELFSSYSLDDEHHDVGCFLYEYNIPKDSLKAAQRRLEKMNVVAKYASGSSCLLVVNRFQSLDEEEEIVIDSSQVDQDCYSGLYPIPNFLGFRHPSAKRGFALPSGFRLYVLEAEPGIHDAKFNLEPNPSMPLKWKNGYSKGIAINEKKRTVIYWSIVW